MRSLVIARGRGNPAGIAGPRGVVEWRAAGTPGDRTSKQSGSLAGKPRYGLLCTRSKA
ncbi:MAG TPA: hypothetical protein VNR89_19025 [Roseomonas sp.]|nr:hypothetical protein [Roseomonas sp.]